jgi:diadenosine tetraphosphatase ApaH/serine/threonine PP2A family protein phosphatase
VRIALLSDIHGNVEALEACLAHARADGAQRYAFLGDFVGYGAEPGAVVDIVTRHAADGAIALKGNHDAAIAQPAGYFNDAAQAALVWARASMTPQQKAFIAALPLIAHEGDVCYVHASAAYPERWEYVDGGGAATRCADAACTAYTFCGHVHDQVLYFEMPTGKMREFRPTPGTPIPVRGHRRWVALVGSVGQPRDRRTAAAYTMFDLTRRELTFHRVAYDAHLAAAKIRRCGLPESLAHRVELGI